MVSGYPDYVYIAAFFFLGVIFVGGALVLSKLLGPSRPTPIKLTSYECGEPPVGSAWVQYNVRFYLFAMLFVIFDVETAFVVPWAVAYGNLGPLAFWEMMIFLGLLAVALVYAWKKGALEWT